MAVIKNPDGTVTVGMIPKEEPVAKTAPQTEIKEEAKPKKATAKKTTAKKTTAKKKD